MVDMERDVRGDWLIDRAIGYPWTYVKNKVYKEDSSYHIVSIVDITARGGIMLLSLTPKGDGSIPAEEVRLAFSELKEGRMQREFSVDRHTDRIRVQLIDPDAPMDRRFTFVDNEGVNQGDYYYVRVRQQDGSMAWSSPIWVGGEPRR